MKRRGCVRACRKRLDSVYNVRSFSMSATNAMQWEL